MVYCIDNLVAMEAFVWTKQNVNKMEKISIMQLK